MKNLMFKKLIIVLIATILTLSSGAILATAIYAHIDKSAPQAADQTAVPSGVPKDAVKISEYFDFSNHLCTLGGGERLPYAEDVDNKYNNASNYYIQDADDLKLFSSLVTHFAAGVCVWDFVTSPVYNKEYLGYDFAGKTIYLANDIDMTGEDWTPIGYYKGPSGSDGAARQGTANPFSGKFEGGYHTISHVTINVNQDGTKTDFVDNYATVGFFGLVAGSGVEIKNLRLSSVSINISGEFQKKNQNRKFPTSYSGIVGLSAGCLVGAIGMTDIDSPSERVVISNCSVVKSEIVSDAKSNSLAVAFGGLVGSVNSGKELNVDGNSTAPRIENCSVDCNIDATKAVGSSFGWAGYFDWWEMNGLRIYNEKVHDIPTAEDPLDAYIGPTDGTGNYYGNNGLDSFDMSTGSPLHLIVKEEQFWNKSRVANLPSKYVAGICGFFSPYETYNYRFTCNSGLVIANCYYHGRLDGTDYFGPNGNSGGDSLAAAEMVYNYWTDEVPGIEIADSRKDFTRAVVADIVVYNSIRSSMDSYLDEFIYMPWDVVQQNGVIGVETCVSYVDPKSKGGNFGFANENNNYFTTGPSIIENLQLSISAENQGPDNFSFWDKNEAALGYANIPYMDSLTTLSVGGGAIGTELNGFYLPRSNEYNNGCPIPSGFVLTTSGNAVIRKSSTVALLEDTFTGIGAEEAKGVEVAYYDLLKKEDIKFDFTKTQLYLPYDPAGTKYTLYPEESKNTSEDNNKIYYYTLYGYEIKIVVPNTLELESVDLVPVSSAKEVTAENPYRLEIKFYLPVDVTFTFGGFYDSTTGKIYKPATGTADEHILCWSEDTYGTKFNEKTISMKYNKSIRVIIEGRENKRSLEVQVNDRKLIYFKLDGLESCELVFSVNDAGEGNVPSLVTYYDVKSAVNIYIFCQFESQELQLKTESSQSVQIQAATIYDNNEISQPASIYVLPGSQINVKKEDNYTRLTISIKADSPWYQFAGIIESPLPDIGIKARALWVYNYTIYIGDEKWPYSSFDYQIIANNGYTYSATKMEDISLQDGASVDIPETGTNTVIVQFTPIEYHFTAWYHTPAGTNITKIDDQTYNVESGYQFSDIRGQWGIYPSYWGVVTDESYWSGLGLTATIEDNNLILSTPLNDGNAKLTTLVSIALVNNGTSQTLSFNGIEYTFKEASGISVNSFGDLPASNQISVPYIYSLYRTGEFELKKAAYVYKDGNGEDQKSTDFDKQYSIVKSDETEVGGASDTLWSAGYYINASIGVKNGCVSFRTTDNYATEVNIYIWVVDPLNANEYLSSKDNWDEIKTYYDITFHVGPTINDVQDIVDSNSYQMAKDSYVLWFEARLKVADLDILNVCQDYSNLVPADTTPQPIGNNLRVLIGSVLQINEITDNEIAEQKYYQIDIQAPVHFAKIFPSPEQDLKALNYKIYIFKSAPIKSPDADEKCTNIYISTKIGYEQISINYAFNSATYQRLDGELNILPTTEEINKLTIRVLFNIIDYEFTTWIDNPSLPGLNCIVSVNQFNVAHDKGLLTYFGIILDDEYWAYFGLTSSLNESGDVLTISSATDGVKSISVKFAILQEKIEDFGFTFGKTSGLLAGSWGSLPSEDDVNSLADNVPYIYYFFDGGTISLQSGQYVYEDTAKNQYFAYGEKQYLVSAGDESTDFAGNANKELWSTSYAGAPYFSVNNGVIKFLARQYGGTETYITLWLIDPENPTEYLSSEDDWSKILRYYDIALHFGGPDDKILNFSLGNSGSYTFGEDLDYSDYVIWFEAKLKVAQLNISSICTDVPGSSPAQISLKQYDYQAVGNMQMLIGSLVEMNYNENDEYYQISITAPEHFAKLFSQLQSEAKNLNYYIYFSNIKSALPNALDANRTYVYVESNNGFVLIEQNPLAYAFNAAQSVELVDGRQLNVVSNIENINSVNIFASYCLATYQLPLYYIMPGTGATNYSYKTVEFNIFSTIDLASESLTSSSENFLFSGWILTTERLILSQLFDGVKIEDEFVSFNNLSQDELNEIFSGLKVTFVIDLTNGNSGAPMFTDYQQITFQLSKKIESVTSQLNGYEFYMADQMLEGSFANITIIENCTNPYIRAFWSKSYNVTINNKIENNLDSVHSEDRVNLSTYFGIYSSKSGQYGSSISFKISDNAKYQYPFFTSNLNGYQTAFYKNTDYSIAQASSSSSGDWWFAYNYGYQIKCWVAYLEFDGNTYYLSLDGNLQWQLTETITAIPVENLNISNANADTRLFGFSEKLMQWTVDSSSSAEIYMYPIWEECKIIATSTAYGYNNLSTNEILYGKTYSFDRYSATTAPEGKKLVYFKTESEDVVPYATENSLMWNYRALSYDLYQFSNNKFYINLTPVFLDNIYKVELRNIRTYEHDATDGKSRLILSSKDYSFADASLNNMFALKVYRFDDANLYTVEDGFKFTSINAYKLSQGDSYIWAENYANVLSNFTSNYQQSISSSSNKKLSILRKVFVNNFESLQTNYTYAMDGEQYPAVTLNNKDGLLVYVYFANGQSVGSLPAFLTDYYQLLLWKNEGVTSNNLRVNYAYLTDLCDAEPDLIQALLRENNLTNYSSTQNSIWNYYQCVKLGVGRDDPLYLESIYFRNYYYLEPSIILKENSRPAEVGYLVIEAKDIASNEESIKYLAICLDNRMIYYSFDYSTNWTSLYNVTRLAEQNGSSALIDTTKLKQVDKIKIFAGCDVTFAVYDQSQDIQAMVSTKYDEMIGYKFVSLTCNFDNDNAFTYQNTIDYPTYKGTIIASVLNDQFKPEMAKAYPVQIIFDKLIYSFDTVLDNELAGSLAITNYAASQTHNNIQFIRDLKFSVDDTVVITYLANLGYEFQNNAFVLLVANSNNSVETLVPYESLLDQDGNIENKFAFKLTASWLREHFYNTSLKQAEYGNFEVSYLDDELKIDKDNNFDAANPQKRENYFGIIKINTSQITFHTATRIYDSSKLGDEAWLETIDDADIWRLGNSVSLVNILKKSSATFDQTKGLSYIYIKDGVNYAFTSAYAYCYANPANVSYLHTDFEFPLYDSSIIYKQYNFSNYLGYILNVSSNRIVPVNSRTIIMVLEVREIFKIDVKVEQQPNDTNSTNRKIKIYTSENNEREIILTPKQSVEDGYYSTTMSLYTYNGLRYNNVATEYDTLRYSGVELTLNDVDVSNRFEVDRDSTLIVKFIPKALNISVNYFLEGEQTTRESLADILTNLSIFVDGAIFVDRAELYLGDVINLTFALNNDYTISIIVNGNDKSIENNSVSHVVIDDDYDQRAININLMIEEKPSSAISVKYQLLNNNQAVSNDNYGNLTIYIDDEAAEGISNVKVLSDKKVSVELDLNAGYVYAGVIGFYGERRNLSLIDGRLEIIPSFTIFERNGLYDSPDAGIYIIYLEKVNVNVILQPDDSISSSYTIDSNSSYTTKTQTGATTQISNAYVGVTISFSIVSAVVDEEFQNFYYLGKDNSKNLISTNVLTITSDLLEKCCSSGDFNIVCGVEILPKYLLDIQIVSDYEGLTDLVETNSELVSGNYYTPGTRATLQFSVAEVDKYDITLTHNGVFVGNGQDGFVSYELTITEATTIVAKISPKRFNIDVDEYHYSYLEDLENSDLQPVEKDGQLNALAVSGENDTLYNFQAQIAIEANPTDSYGDWQLTRLDIVTLEGLLIKIEIINEKIVVSLNDEQLSAEDGIYQVNGGDRTYSYKIELIDGKLSISYLTQQDVHISAYYTSLKTIEPSK